MEKNEMVYELSNMTWSEAKEKFNEAKLAIVPIGATEQHGMHLGLGADWITAWDMAKRIGEKTDRLVLPVMPYGVSGHHKEFPGVITLKQDTLQKVIYEILSSLNRYGINRVIFINGHGGNQDSITAAAKEARENFNMICAILQWWNVWADRTVLGHRFEAHAGHAETAFMLSAKPEAVRSLKKAILTPTKQWHENIELINANTAKYKDGLVYIPLNTIDVSDTGSMTECHPDIELGTTDYSGVTQKFAEKLTEEFVEWLCEFVIAFETFDIPPLKAVTIDRSIKAGARCC